MSSPGSCQSLLVFPSPNRAPTGPPVSLHVVMRNWRGRKPDQSPVCESVSAVSPPQRKESFRDFVPRVPGWIKGRGDATHRDPGRELRILASAVKFGKAETAERIEQRPPDCDVRGRENDGSIETASCLRNQGMNSPNSLEEFGPGGQKRFRRTGNGIELGILFE